MSQVSLIAGLGNPGPEYAHARHNIGFAVVDRLADKLGVDFDRDARTKFQGLLLDVPTPAGKLLLFKPMTYMNRSGDAIQQAARFYKLEASDCMVVLDEIQLPAGEFKLARSGSDGGHNGLRDIQQKLATNAYPRLRLGVDRPPPGRPQADYVLGRPSPEQRDKMTAAATKAAEALLTWQAEGIDAAMNKHNVKKTKPKPSPRPEPELDASNSPFADAPLTDASEDVDTSPA